MFTRHDNWHRESVASRLRIAQRQLEAIGGDGEVGIYADFVRLHRNHFGNRPDEVDYRSADADYAFRWVTNHCARENIEVVVWMTAQMNSMVPFITRIRADGKTPSDFLPRMMTGDNARTRYAAFLRNGCRYTGRVGTHAFAFQEARNKFIAEVLTEDAMFREQFVVSLYHGASAADLATPYGVETFSEPWRITNSLCGIKPRIATNEKFGAGFTAALRVVMNLHSIVEVATLFEYALGERLAPNSDNWTFEGFAVWLRGAFALPVPQVLLPIRGDDSLVYHNDVVTDTDGDDDDDEDE